MNALTWQTDPFLLDPEPLEQNKWFTANELIHTKNQQYIFSPKGYLQLYAIMVRKIDFVSGERLLQGFPYLLLDNQWCTTLREQTLLLAERAYHYFQGAISNTSILSWQKKLIQYLEEQQRLPFPLFRLADDWEEFFVDKQFVRFQSARGEDFQLPLYLSEELAYLVGVIMGDGHLAEYFINVIDSSKEHIENLAKLLVKHFHSKIEVFEQQNANAWNVNILGKWIVRFINFLSAQLINERKYPHLCQPALFCNNNLLRVAFWRGVMDADGGYKNNISFGSASKALIDDFISFLKVYDIKYHLYHRKYKNAQAHILNISSTSRKEFAQIVGTNHPEKCLELQELLTRKEHSFVQKAQTLQKQGYWQSQVFDFNLQKITQGYFDFSYFSQYSLMNVGNFIRNLRFTYNKTQQQVAKKTNISRGMLSSYELNSTSLPIPIFLRLLDFYQTTLLDFLSLHQTLDCHSRSAKCRLPTQPTTFLLELLQGVQLKSKNYLLLIGQANSFLEDDYKRQFCDYFALPLPNTRKLNNTVLNAFIREFCLLRTSNFD
ncbi:MAG: helix-turn-helix domain-containing protein [Candidatus Heimdallarchaeota archaeon]|nr:helix-turn-helix domain-containing protein [Candidatus Heimdallarchaeota archaeon]